MHPDRWQRLRELFEAASKLEPDQRHAYLDQACADDAGLRREVESLLARDTRGGDALGRVIDEVRGVSGADRRGPAISPGDVLGRFRVLEKIGEGGMGEIFRAEDSTLDREVALKVLPPDLAASQERLARFEREAKSLAALEHPNIVSVHTIETAVPQGVQPPTNLHFLTMQLVDGRKLAELIPEGGMPVEQIIDIAIPLSDALAAAHRRGIVHRDLKPSNVMVTEGDRVMVLDFGLAKLRTGDGSEPAAEPERETLTREGQLIGTPSYMSPEQIRGRELDARSDIFSLGVVLYEMATGERPFRGSSSPEVISSILKDTPQRVGALRPALPRSLGRLIARCLQKDPGRRHQSADEVLGELEGLRDELRARSGGWLGAARALSYRRPSAWAWAAVLAPALVALIIAGAYLYESRADRGTREGIPDRSVDSLAVLPLRSLMQDPEQEYFADGMTEELINSLARIGAIRVVSRTSVMKFKGTDQLLPEIASQLGVDLVVEGSVLRGEDRVRITAQLIDASNDRHLWAGSYQRELRDVLRLQSELARTIAGEIRVQLTPEQERMLAQAPVVDPEAHDAYLKGLFQEQKESVNGYVRAQEYFRQAVDIDPSFAAAFAGLAEATAFLALSGVRPPATMEGAKEAAEHALALDETLAEAHNSLALIKGALDFDWSGAEWHHRRAIELSPNAGIAYYRYSMFLRQLRRYEEAIEMADRALGLDPLSLQFQTQYGAAFYHARQYGKAVELLERVVEMEPGFHQAQWNLLLAYAANGDYSEAIEVLTTIRKEDGSPQSEEIIAATLQAWARSGWSGALEYVVELHEERARRGQVSPFLIAVFRALLGQREEVLDLLEEAERTGDPAVGWVYTEPVFDHLRSEPRFQDLLRRLNFPV